MKTKFKTLKDGTKVYEEPYNDEVCFKTKIVRKGARMYNTAMVYGKARVYGNNNYSTDENLYEKIIPFSIRTGIKDTLEILSAVLRVIFLTALISIPIILLYLFIIGKI